MLQVSQVGIGQRGTAKACDQVPFSPLKACFSSIMFALTAHTSPLSLCLPLWCCAIITENAMLSWHFACTVHGCKAFFKVTIERGFLFLGIAAVGSFHVRPALRPASAPAPASLEGWTDSTGSSAEEEEPSWMSVSIRYLPYK